MAMATETFTNDSSLKHVECREKCRRAVANVVMGHRSQRPRFRGNRVGCGARAWICLVDRVRLVVDDIKAYDISKLLHEMFVGLET